MQQRIWEKSRVVIGTKKRKNRAQARLGMYAEWDYGDKTRVFACSLSSAESKRLYLLTKSSVSFSPA